MCVCVCIFFVCACCVCVRACARAHAQQAAGMPTFVQLGCMFRNLQKPGLLTQTVAAGACCAGSIGFTRRAGATRVTYRSLLDLLQAYPHAIPNMASDQGFARPKQAHEWDEGVQMHAHVLVRVRKDPWQKPAVGRCCRRSARWWRSLRFGVARSHLGHAMPVVSPANRQGNAV